jgi:two-component system phosphate regulon sensor histidine kinase PhoR
MLGLHPGEEDANLFRLFDTDVKNWFMTSDAEKPLLNVVSPASSEAYLDFFLLPYTLSDSLVVLRDSTKMRRLEKMRSDFVANVSHELRTPLTVIHGYLELIEQQENPELQTIISEMQKQSSRMNHLVEDLLNLSRLESGNMLPEEAISTGALLHTLQQEAVALSQGRHQITLVPDFNGLLIGSPKDIHSAVSNLVSNAVRYTSTDGSIAIGSKRRLPTAPCWAAVVSDAMIEPRNTPCSQSKASVTSGTADARRPPNRMAEIGTPFGSAHSGAMAGHCSAGQAKRALG